MQFRITLLACIAAIALTGPAFAGDRLYVGVGAGFEKPDSTHWSVPVISQSGDFSVKDSGAYILDAGYKFYGLRLELEGQYGDFDGRHIAIRTPVDLSSPLGGHISQSTVYLNANYDVHLIGGWSVTAGGGVGNAWNSAHGSAFSGLSIVRGNDSAFAWQVGGGVIRELLPNLDLQLDYRYQGIGTTKLTEAGTGEFELGKFKTESVILSLRWYVIP